MNKQLDVIIPAYNSQETIIRTLSSIAMQLNRNELKVTIVNDGGKDYKDIVNTFSNILDIQEIGYEENKGPGYARQYGVDNTSLPFITFIDADDTFYEACSLSILLKPMKDTSAKFIISPFVQVGKNQEQAPVNANLVWVFGHIYRRAFLEQHNIRMTPTRSNEDVGYNCMCNFIAQNEMGVEGGKILSAATYEWHYNEASITRRGENEYEYGICTPGYIYNRYNAFKVAQREGVPLKVLANDILESVFSSYIYYQIALDKEVPQYTLDAILNVSKRLYDEYYDKIQQYISKDDYKNIYTKSLQDKMAHSQGVIFKQTLDGFLQMLKDLNVEIRDYGEIEKEVLAKIKT